MTNRDTFFEMTTDSLAEASALAAKLNKLIEGRSYFVLLAEAGGYPGGGMVTLSGLDVPEEEREEALGMVLSIIARSL